jgi:hypothetical protein
MLSHGDATDPASMNGIDTAPLANSKISYCKTYTGQDLPSRPPRPNRNTRYGSICLPKHGVDHKQTPHSKPHGTYGSWIRLPIDLPSGPPP